MFEFLHQLASGLALSLVLSRLVLRERLAGAESWCVAAMIVSLVLLALSQEAGPADTAHNASALPAVALIVPSIAAGLLIAVRPLRPRLGRHRSAATGICAGIGTGLLYGVASLTTKGLSGILTRSHTAGSIVAGNDIDQHVQQLQDYVDAGYDEVFVANMGPHYLDMISAYGQDVLPRLR